MTKTFLPNFFSVDAHKCLFGRSHRSRHVLLVLQLLESIFLYDYFRRKHFISQTGFFFFFLEQRFLFSEFHKSCPWQPRSWAAGSGGDRTPKMGGGGAWGSLQVEERDWQGVFRAAAQGGVGRSRFGPCQRGVCVCARPQHRRPRLLGEAVESFIAL